MPSPKFTDTFTLGAVEINFQFSQDDHDNGDDDDDDETHWRQRLTAIDIFESADGLVVSTNLFFSKQQSWSFQIK